MAITQAMCDSFKVQLLNGQQNFSANTYKIALYTSSATLSNATTAYTTSNEVVGSGYTVGGNTLTVSVTPTSTGNVAYLSFANTSWTAATISANGALIYNNSLTGGLANAAVAVLNFGSTITSTAGTFTIVFPTAAAGTAIIQIA
jgi:hypothetical protein